MFWEKENGLVCNFLSWKKKTTTTCEALQFPISSFFQCVKSKSVTNLAEATADPMIDVPLSQQAPGAPPQPLGDGSPPQARVGSAPSLGPQEWRAGVDWGCLLRVQCLGVHQIRLVLKILKRQLMVASGIWILKRKLRHKFWNENEFNTSRRVVVGLHALCGDFGQIKFWYWRIRLVLADWCVRLRWATYVIKLSKMNLVKNMGGL